MVSFSLFYFILNPVKTELEITAGHHCGGETFRVFSAHSAEKFEKYLLHIDDLPLHRALVKHILYFILAATSYSSLMYSLYNALV